ncbi:MAG: barstar family protein [Saprospiraceae bacterium]|nr:barstar family protein [Saprospiraceae bacterium]
MTFIKLFSEEHSKISIAESALVVHIDGCDCTTLNECYALLSKRLYFPDYFSNNLDSLSEVLGDLSWLHQDKIILFIDNYNDFLSAETDIKRQTFLQLLNDAIAEHKSKKEKRLKIYLTDTEKSKIDLSLIESNTV